MTQTVDTLFTDAVVLTMDKSFRIYSPGAVAVTGHTITAVGPADELAQEFTARKTISCRGQVLMPGLINGHTHVPMTLLRGLADDLRLDVWLMGYMMPVEREFVSPEFVRLGTRLACAEMIRSGITTFCDMYYFEEDVALAAAECGMRAVCGESILKFPTPDAPSYEESLAYVRGFIERWKNHELIVPAVAPHAIYTCTEEILRASAALAVEYDVPLVIHLSETAQEVENNRREHGMPVIPYVKRQNLFDAKVIAAHCVHVDEGEIRQLANVGAGVVHNPSSNLKLASGMAPIKKMLELGVKLGLGTDGPASNNDLDMFEEIRLASLLAKGSSGDPTTMPARTTLLAATRMGASALHLDHITGSIEPGKRADLICVEIDPLHNSPNFRRDPNGVYAQIVYAAKSTDVRDVMINGKILLQDHQLVEMSEAELLAEANEYAVKIDAFLLKREKSVLSKLIAIGGASEQESFEVQVKVEIARPEEIAKKLEAIEEFQIIRRRHYRQYDTYFHFGDVEQGRLRYREDHFVEEDDTISQVRSRLTHIGPAKESSFSDQVYLSRSRFLAPANQSLRFYREYFKPTAEHEIEKDRLRYLIEYQGIEFFINIDTVKRPEFGTFLEIKSRTWSRTDAARKSKLIARLLDALDLSTARIITSDYIEMIKA